MGWGKALAQAGSWKTACCCCCLPCQKALTSPLHRRTQWHHWPHYELSKWLKHSQKHRKYLQTQPCTGTRQQPGFQLELAAVPLGNIIKPWDWVVDRYLTSPLWRWKEQLHKRVGSVPVKSKLKPAVAFLLCHPLDIQKQPKIDGWFNFSSVFPIEMEFHPAWRKPPLFWEQETLSWGQCC